MPPPASAEKLNKLGPEHPTHIVTFDESVVEAEDDGVVEEDERHTKNADMWRNQNQKMKIMLHRLEKKHGFKATHIYSWASNGFAANLNQKQIEDIKAIRSAHIEENQAFLLASSPPWNNQTNNGQTVGWGIYATAANLSSALSGANTQIKDLSKTRIYILDTGVSAVHPELNVVKNLSATMDGSFNDCDGHGTAVAGIAAAKNNNSGMSGVAPGAPIISIIVFEGCTGPASTANVVRGIDSAMYEERVYFRNIPSYLLGAAVLNLSIEAPIGGLSLYNYNPFSTSQIAVKNSLQSATTRACK